ncbi:hypothetical protein KKC08_01635 [Patescibacteria group bacterium]|nr:hypothetical protein [Patescibacteria group bacterium]MCG2701775.1 hypothetical protein [Candidatus Parcubacteria bacterium]MBU4264679.1 hypothetical protein [Patescibacteria group bacterium]MBU4390634.1 hypothetical protein [Patescibacteria group bacterium]MBU4396853.1 hypothetical protein [Patescibacteria group bacterium]
MVKIFKEILEEIVSRKGEVNLFAILKMDEYTEKWTVILSAPWVNDENTRECFLLLRTFMIKKFSREEMDKIARMGVFTKDEHIITELLKFKEGTVIEEDEKINGNLVHEAHILASNSSL